jgi:flagella basal body P-ring formation protein FlgA
MNAGEVVQASDLVWTKLAGNPADAPSDSAALVGMEVRRPLRAGAAAGLHDISAPMVIKTGDMVEVRYNDGGVSLTLQAKALGPAAAGQLFAVENPSSKKVIQALAQAPGVALVGPAAVAARAPAQQFAAR